MSAFDRETPEASAERRETPQAGVSEAPAGAQRRETPSGIMSRIDIAAAAPDHAICKNCGRAKSDGHGKAGYSCLPRNGVSRKSVFEPEDK